MGEKSGRARNNINIGRLLAHLIEAKEITQYKLAKDSGVSRTFINGLITGRTSGISVGKARKLADALGVRPEIFLSSKDSVGMYTSKHHFEGYLKELKEKYSLDVSGYLDVAEEEEGGDSSD